MAFVRDEAARAQMPARGGRRDERHLRNDLLRDVAEAHERAGLEADLLEPRLQFAILIEHVARLVAGPADRRRGLEHDDRHAVVDQRRLDAGDAIDRMAGRQQRAADRAGRIEKLDRDRRRRAGHAVDARIAAVGDAPASASAP